MRLKLIISFTLVALVSIATLLIVVRQSAIQEVRTYMFRGGMAGVDGIVRELENYYETNDSWVGVEQILSTGSESPGKRYGNQGGLHGLGGMMGGMMSQRLRLADSNGYLILDTEGGIQGGKLTGPEIQAAIKLENKGEIVGFLLPEGGMVFSSGAENNLIGRLTRAAYVAAGVAIGFAVILALLLSAQLLKPVSQLTEAASSLAGGNLSLRVSIPGDDELATLGKTFNQMANELENAEHNRRAMTADIAHELRTPLAVQRAQLEAIQDGVYPPTSENITSILEQNMLLTRLVDDLRTLALADSGQLQLEMVPTDLPKLVERVLDNFKAKAIEREIDLRFKVFGEGREIEVDPGRVEQICSNLLSNALRFTPDQSWIETRLRFAPDMVLVSVIDNGPGIPEEAQELIFTRFYRLDQSRSRSEGGSGLGLAIARQLAEAQGGTLNAINNPGGGATFRLSFPIGEV